MYKYTLLTILVLFPTLCFAQSLRGDTVQRNQAQRGQQVIFGKITDIRTVAIEGNSDIRGAAAGGVLGYAAGRSIGGGSGNKAARAIGGVGGALAGRNVQRRANSADGLELTVKLDTGETYAIVQERDNSYRVGDRVRVLVAPDGTMRVRL